MDPWSWTPTNPENFKARRTGFWARRHGLGGGGGGPGKICLEGVEKRRFWRRDLSALGPCGAKANLQFYRFTKYGTSKHKYDAGLKRSDAPRLDFFTPCIKELAPSGELFEESSWARATTLGVPWFGLARVELRGRETRCPGALDLDQWQTNSGRPPLFLPIRPIHSEHQHFACCTLHRSVRVVC